jgi:hypothetical protein
VVKEIVGGVWFLVGKCANGGLVVDADDGVAEAAGQGIEEVGA